MTTSNGKFTGPRATDTDRAIAKRLKAARILSGKSQEQLADAIGVTFQQVQKYEDGSNRVSCGKMVMIAAALNVTAGSILDADAPTFDTDIRSRFSYELLRKVHTLSKPQQDLVQMFVENMHSMQPAREPQ